MHTQDPISSIVKHLPALTKLLLMLVTAALIPIMFPHEGHGDHYDYVEGGLWRNNDLVAQHDFVVRRSQTDIDEEVAAAKSKLLLYYSRDVSAYSQAQERLNALVGRHPALASPRYRKTLDSIYSIGYAEMPQDIPDFQSHTIVLLEGNMGSETQADQYVCALDIADSLLRDSVLVPSIAYDANRTNLELESRLSQIATSSQVVRQGELIIAQGEEVTPERAQVIRSLEQDNDKRFLAHYSPFGRFLGQFALCIIAFMALYMFLKNTRHTILEDNGKVTFVMVLVLLISAATALVVRTNAEWVLIVPLCIVPVLMRIFFDIL